MTSIVLFSDNHGERSIFQQLLQEYPHADAFVHCGDSCMRPEELERMMPGVISVEGNNDPLNAYPDYRILSYERRKIYVCHGHHDMIYGHYEMLARTARMNDCSMVFFGHTHVPFDETIDGIRLLNPGSSWHNRDGSSPSYMLVQLNGDEVTVFPENVKKD